MGKQILRLSDLCYGREYSMFVLTRGSRAISLTCPQLNLLSHILSPRPVSSIFRAFAAMQANTSLSNSNSSQDMNDTKTTSSVVDVRGGEPAFGTRYLKNPEEVFKHNAW
jgi:hypothetical protein